MTKASGKKTVAVKNSTRSNAAAQSKTVAAKVQPKKAAKVEKKPVMAKTTPSSKNVVAKKPVGKQVAAKPTKATAKPPAKPAAKSSPPAVKKQATKSVKDSMKSASKAPVAPAKPASKTAAKVSPKVAAKAVAKSTEKPMAKAPTATKPVAKPVNSKAPSEPKVKVVAVADDMDEAPVKKSKSARPPGGTGRRPGRPSKNPNNNADSEFGDPNDGDGEAEALPDLKPVKRGKRGKGEGKELLARGPVSPEEYEARRNRLKLLIKLGKDRGYLTYGEINDHLPDDLVDAEAIDGIISTFSDMGIAVYDQAPDAETLLIGENAPMPTSDDDVEDEAEAALTTVDSDFGRTTDPVRMYMRDISAAGRCCTAVLYVQLRRDSRSHRKITSFSTK